MKNIRENNEKNKSMSYQQALDEVIRYGGLPKDDEGYMTIGVLKVKNMGQTIKDAKEKPPLKKLIGDLWMEGEVCIFFGEPSAGKSIFAVMIADALSSGENVFPELVNEMPPLRVLYLDCELSDRQQGARFSAEKKREYDRAELDFTNTQGTHEDAIKDSLEEFLTQVKYDVVIVDNITFVEGNAEDQPAAGNLMKWAKQQSRKHSCSILILAHTPKRVTLKYPMTGNDLAGSRKLYNFADSVFCIGKSAQGNNVRYLKTIKTKSTGEKYTAENVLVLKESDSKDELLFTMVGHDEESNHLDAGEKFGVPSKRSTIKQLIRFFPGTNQSELAKVLRDKNHPLGYPRQEINRWIKD